MKNTADNIYETNKAIVAGVVLTPLEFSHKTYGEAFYTFVLGIERRSGYVDEINVMISERLIFDNSPECDDFVEITGQVRTYNESVNGRNKLNVVIFAREILINRDVIYYENYIFLEGFLCKPPVKRTSPLGRDICDLMIAVNRMYNKSDYIPCIAWGRNAGYADNLKVGTGIYIEGRIQSREYKKKLEDGTAEIRKAFEVSILKIEEACREDEPEEEY
ncbi:MAG: single-stranded DNA-binding protein [Candidatus Fimisoma sp.]|nr:single-stranded DNA-binding protein [Bacillota bacterium]MDY4748582.1 single-stranded DNA-binding protein [Candidatus Fimisoma sp.]